ncbi:cytochrome [Citrobacter sp. Cpo113]|uniref:cytochrome n=1 Tax=Citrobacter sp. Cpo113 TaxID=2985146 RepID=UPI002578864D|nr:cytochrome [Citrobacter sp. Cpo113]MDM2788096.1 cytochrome [Citrobacter sp. Cpo113]
MNFDEMLASLSPSREPVEINGFKFYARPMTVSEFGEFYFKNENTEERNDRMILNCIQHEDGTPVFKEIAQVQKLYTTVRSQLASAVSNASILTKDSDVLEKN